MRWRYVGPLAGIEVALDGHSVHCPRGEVVEIDADLSAVADVETVTERKGR